jgi:hypothetical protein
MLNIMSTTLLTHSFPSVEAVSACLDKYTQNIDKATVENDQDEEIESMLSAVEVELQASETCNGEHVIHEIPAKNKKAKLDVREASLKAASA